jgi:hypothetical protein
MEARRSGRVAKLAPPIYAFVPMPAVDDDNEDCMMPAHRSAAAPAPSGPAIASSSRGSTSAASPSCGSGSASSPLIIDGDWQSDEDELSARELKHELLADAMRELRVQLNVDLGAPVEAKDLLLNLDAFCRRVVGEVGFVNTPMGKSCRQWRSERGNVAQCCQTGSNRRRPPPPPPVCAC